MKDWLDTCSFLKQGSTYRGTLGPRQSPEGWGWGGQSHGGPRPGDKPDREPCVKWAAAPRMLLLRKGTWAVRAATRGLPPQEEQASDAARGNPTLPLRSPAVWRPQPS